MSVFGSVQEFSTGSVMQEVIEKRSDDTVSVVLPRLVSPRHELAVTLQLHEVLAMGHRPGTKFILDCSYVEESP